MLRISDEPTDDVCRAWAAALAAGRTAVASHDSAAALWGLRGGRERPLQATCAPGQHRRIPGLRVHLAPLTTDEVRRVCDLPATTTLRRTVIDCLLSWERSRGQDMIVDALRRRLIDVSDVGTLVLESSGRLGHDAAVTAFRAVAGSAWSDGEVRLHREFRRAGIVGWTANARVFDAAGLIGLADALFAEQRLVVEVDGRAYHEDPDTFQRDRTRQNRLMLAGYTVLRFTWDDVACRPSYVIATVQRHLDRHVLGRGA